MNEANSSIQNKANNLSFTKKMFISLMSIIGGYALIMVVGLPFVWLFSPLPDSYKFIPHENLIYSKLGNIFFIQAVLMTIFLTSVFLIGDQLEISYEEILKEVPVFELTSFSIIVFIMDIISLIEVFNR
ncbi:hypothetical protein [Halobacteriovorax sp. HLS]|uniref:hypothetical protein n=1 Tax=Halobacteriovorax sp. HLS TaxID=2234000 RepID=UPI000FD6CD91|nr:hypothetical protein [Halobacteriovorax sp. HLS]